MATASKRNRMMNRARILRAIWRRPGSSRVDIVGVLGLDKSTVSSIVTELLKGEIVREVAEGDSSPLGGRRPVHLQLNPGYGDVLGVAMGGLVNSIGNVIYRSIPMEIEEEYDFQRRISRDDRGAGDRGERRERVRLGGTHRTPRENGPRFSLRPRTDPRIDDGRVPLRRYRRLGVAINGTLYPGAHFTAGEFQSAFRNAEGIGQFTLTEEEEARVPTDRSVRSRFFRELAKNIALIVNVMDRDHISLAAM